LRCAEKLKRNAEEKTSEAMRLLNEKSEFAGKKLQELQRQADLRQGEIKDCLAKGQKEKAKLILKRKKMIEKQMAAVQNVRLSGYVCYIIEHESKAQRAIQGKDYRAKPRTSVRCVRQFQIIARNKSRKTRALTPKVLCVSTEPKPAAVDHIAAQYYRTQRVASEVGGATALAGAAAPR
jgi:hypothetical protein